MTLFELITNDYTESELAEFIAEFVKERYDDTDMPWAWLVERKCRECAKRRNDDELECDLALGFVCPYGMDDPANVIEEWLRSEV